MNIDRLPSGSYRVRKMFKGKTYTFVLDHKPSKAEIAELLEDNVDSYATKPKEKVTFYDAAMRYIDTKYNVLSPSTRRGYKNTLSRLSDPFKESLLKDIDQFVVQKEINRLTAEYSPKTVANTNGFVTAVMSMFRPTLTLNITLPQKVKKESYIPTDEDIKRILESVKDTRYYIPFCLGVLGMRRSEICAARPEDLDDDNLLTINKAMVQDENYQWHVKTTKTTESTRQIYVPAAVADRIRHDNVIYDGNDTGLWKRLDKEQKKLGIPHFRFHDLRAYYASLAHAMGIPDKYIQAAGGWKTDSVMKNVYRRAMKDEYKKTQDAYIDRIKDML